MAIKIDIHRSNNFQKWRLTSVTFCLICCCKVWGEASFDSTERVGVAVYWAEWTACRIRLARLPFPGPRPASRRLQCAYCKQREAGQGPGKEAAWCERLPEQQAGINIVICRFQASCFTNPQHYCTAGNKTGSKSPINQKKCVVANALLLYSK